MKRATSFFFGCAFVFGVLLAAPAPAEQHRATRLGNPATRFAPPLATPEDLRARFRDEKLKPDIASILRQWGWPGNLEDLHGAALTNEIVEVKIPVGDTMPFMSSRENGQPVCLRNVLWAGAEPISAYAFTFSSKGRRYQCITPKPCSNFYLEDLGPEPRLALTLACDAPAQVIAGRPVEVCLTVRNTGNVPLHRTFVGLPVPSGATVVRTGDGGVATAERVSWELANLEAGDSRRVCVVFAMREPGLLSFSATAEAAGATTAPSSCATTIVGIPAILLEVVDLEDPIEVGKEVTYEIKVTNQGTAPGTNIRLVCTLPTAQEFVSGTGFMPVSAQADTLTLDAIPVLAPKAVASWRVVVKATQAADARFKVELRGDQFALPITEDESTQQY